MVNINYKGSSKECIKFYLRLLSLLDKDSTLTESEATVLIEFMTLPEKFRYMRFSSSAKNRVAAELKLSKVNINNKLYSLIAKKYLVRDEDNIIYPKPFLVKFMENFKGSLEIKLNLEDTNVTTDKH